MHSSNSTLRRPLFGIVVFVLGLLTLSGCDDLVTEPPDDPLSPPEALASVEGDVVIGDGSGDEGGGGDDEDPIFLPGGDLYPPQFDLDQVPDSAPFNSAQSFEVAVRTPIDDEGNLSEPISARLEAEDGSVILDLVPNITGTAFDGIGNASTVEFIGGVAIPDDYDTSIYLRIEATNVAGTTVEREEIRVFFPFPFIQRAASTFPTATDTDTPIEVDLRLQQSASASAPIVVVNWGDGHLAEVQRLTADPLRRVLQHKYESPGEYDVEIRTTAEEYVPGPHALTATRFDVETFRVTVAPAPRFVPEIANLAAPTTGFTGQRFEVSFDPGAPAAAELLDVRTDWGPGITLTKATGGQRRTISYTWDSPGTYDVELSVSNTAFGKVYTDTETFQVTIAASEVCEPGTWWTGSTCRAAQEGFFVKDAGATRQTACPVGTYQDQPGQTGCIQTPPGTFVATLAQTAPTLCPVGTAQPLAGAKQSCPDVPAGHYAPEPGTAEPIPCPAGTYQPETGSAECVAADAGSFATGPAATAQEPCAPGTFSATAGREACDPAPAGSFVELSGQVSAIPCPAGSFAAEAGSVSCASATPGHFVSGAGASAQTACEPGTFSGASGAVHCDPAVPGHYVPSAGASSQTPCSIGTWQDQEGAAACRPAPAGAFVAVEGANGFEPCEPGTFQPAEGAASCDPAPAGSYVPGAGATGATLCVPGTFQGATGATTCEPAMPGTIAPDAGMTAPVPCAPGSFQAAAGQTSCDPAPIGFYVDVEGATAPTACLDGTTTLDVGASAASDCITFAEAARKTLESAIAEGSVGPATGGRGGDARFESWVSSVERAIASTEGPQWRAGCAQLSRAIRDAERGGRNAVVSGTGLADVLAALRALEQDVGCG